TPIPTPIFALCPIVIYTLYESSPRRSPRHPTHPPSENILKPKSNSPIHKSNSALQGKKPRRVKKPLSSSNALANVTGTRKVRKLKIKDENKENCGSTAPRRTPGLGVNESTIQGKMARRPLQEKKDSRMPM